MKDDDVRRWYETRSWLIYDRRKVKTRIKVRGAHDTPSPKRRKDADTR